MPEYLAPGVFVEETSFRSKSIQGVGTSTTAFAGPTRKGPLGMASDVLTSFGEFERIYGGLQNLSIGGTSQTNYLAHAAKAFFDNGGARLYISRTFTPTGGGNPTQVSNSASGAVTDDEDPANTLGTFRARAPGQGLNGTIIAYQKITPAAETTLNSAPVGTMVQTVTSADPAVVTYYVKGTNGSYVDNSGANDGTEILDAANIPDGTNASIITLNLEIRLGAATADGDAEGGPIVMERLGFGPGHPKRLGDALVQNPASRGQALSQPYWFDQPNGTTAFTLRDAFFGDATTDSSRVISVTGGIDGGASVATDDGAQIVSYSDALEQLADINDIAIVAAPGGSATLTNFDANMTATEAIHQALLSHAENLRYRVAVLDTPPAMSSGDARNVRAGLDSKYGALYYPWVVVSNPAARPSDDTIPKEIALPPSGFMCGIYARNDIQRGVWKAPANEVVRGALRFEREVTRGEQEVLNPEGINCLRSFFGRGNRVWGARTISSDPEWTYLNVRRYFIYVEDSIDRSTQWAVFEPNGPRLWSNLVDTISSFLFAEWRSGALLGSTPEEAFFVRCDRSTMTQADIDNGRAITEVGIAAIKPAEFVIFRIGQKTADA